MRDIPEELAARIESGAATLCHAWVLTTVDGGMLGFTDHDRDLTLGGVICKAASGWTAGAAEGEVGLAAGSLVVGGALDSETLTEADITAGRYDGARVETWKVDWARPDLKVRLSVGTVAKMRREGDRFLADLQGPLAALERVVGRTYGRDCDAVLGDGRCGVDREAFPGLGCDRRWTTCVGTFANGINFQGFADIPGDDFLTAYPAEGGPHDGASRR
ncbi:baseplate hub domain-containing protein [Brevundimonas goettingensis]|uniref:DUF2163 domain-containing protein n=1 Tax=Brevundimonas goettingensis TaxID=2774190 RepID=A0A975C0N3_9CAUL|nr:DUF2163 domain-containing protein [Brevundimonas goettingensis]QTC91603.1 DUF2163 domain-containing protein [Brevundimonas goettingensis]